MEDNSSIRRRADADASDSRALNGGGKGGRGKVKQGSGKKTKDLSVKQDAGREAWLAFIWKPRGAPFCG